MHEDREQDAADDEERRGETYLSLQRPAFATTFDRQPRGLPGQRAALHVHDANSWIRGQQFLARCLPPTAGTANHIDSLVATIEHCDRVKAIEGNVGRSLRMDQREFSRCADV